MPQSSPARRLRNDRLLAVCPSYGVHFIPEDSALRPIFATRPELPLTSVF